MIGTNGYREPEFRPWDGRRVPITFVGGYLGAGKTTAINALLAHTDRPIAVIVNDVGAINIDAKLIRRRHGDTIELTDGCVCCSSIEGMGAAFDQIRARPIPPEQVVVELSGVAEPTQVLPWGQSAGFMLDGLVVVVAADQLIDSTLPGWVQQRLVEQIQAADLLILTKTDLYGALIADMARRRLAEIAPNTAIFHAGRDLVGPAEVGRFLALGGGRPGPGGRPPDSTLFDAHTVRLVSVPPVLTVYELTTWLHGIGGRFEGQLVRAKGLIATTDGGLVQVQIVGNRVEVTPVPEPERQNPTDLVAIFLPYA